MHERLRRNLLVYAMSTAALSAAATSAYAQSPTGGAAYPSGGTTTSTAPASPATDAAPAPAVPAAVADGQLVTSVAPNSMMGAPVSFAGRVGPHDAGKAISIERQDPLTGWMKIATATAAPDGSFKTSWLPDKAGVFSTRATLVGASAAQAGNSAAAPISSAPVGLTVFKASESTWFGPGFYGHKTACGLKLTKSMLGVAHKTLKCGTQVQLLYQGKTIVVPVIDRGPFRDGTDWDLTNGTAQALGFTTTDDVGAVTRRDIAPLKTPMSAPAVKKSSKKKRS